VLLLIQATLSYATLSGADLSQANLSQAIVEKEQLAQATYLAGATLPDRSIYPSQSYPFPIMSSRNYHQEHKKRTNGKESHKETCGASFFFSNTSRGMFLGDHSAISSWKYLDGSIFAKTAVGQQGTSHGTTHSSGGTK
jgi:hypothetical protein